MDVSKLDFAPGVSVDPGFMWALVTSFRHLVRRGETLPKLLPVIVELKDKGVGGGLAGLRKELGLGGFGDIASAYARLRVSNGTMPRHLTARFSLDYCQQVLAGKAGQMIERFELQLPVLPERARPLAPHSPQPTVGATRAPSKSKVLLGMIDSGCAFAHHQLRDQRGRGTRVLHLWDQDEQPAHARGPNAGAEPADFGYGCEVSRTTLNRIMAAHRAGNGTVDEAACYAEAGDLRLRRRFNHGMAVLGLMAGPLPLGARLHLPRDAGKPFSPSWTKADDMASQSDIVFVQLPRDTVQDSSSASLSRAILDGLRYIVSCAGEQTEHIVVNLSDGSSRGTHDGRSIIELAMIELIEQQAALPKPRTLSIAVAAGNSHDEERHAQFNELAAGSTHTVTLRVPPGSETPSFVTVVLPLEPTDLSIRLVPPTGPQDASPMVASGHVWPGYANQRPVPVCTIVNPAAQKNVRSTALIAFAPTVSRDPDAPPARAGDWKIELHSEIGVDAEIHLYISRTQTNPGALRRAFQARFVDVDTRYDPGRHLRAWEQDPPSPQSPLRRAGTLSSLATVAPGQGIYVVGSCMLREQVPSLYSSEGPGLPNGARQARRVNPDWLAVTDVSRALRGVCAAGTASGDTVRVVGTSFSAPQAARALANAARPTSLRKMAKTAAARAKKRAAAQAKAAQARAGKGVVPIPAKDFEPRRRAVAPAPLLP